jgi:hypothetical protein
MVSAITGTIRMRIHTGMLIEVNRQVHGIRLDHQLRREEPEVQNDRRQEHEHRAVEAELPSTLNHLGNPELWTLNSVEAHERKADESTCNNRNARPHQIESHEDQHSAENHRKDVGVQSEPQSELIADSPVALRIGNLIDGMGLDAGAISMQPLDMLQLIRQTFHA